MMNYENTESQFVAKWKEQAIKAFGFLLMVVVLSVLASPASLYAQCKTVKAGSMSICAPSGWEVEVETDEEDNTASIYLTSQAEDSFRTYAFMDIYVDEDLEDLMRIVMKDALENAKWSKVKKTTFQSYDAREVSGVAKVNGLPLNVVVLAFNGSNELSYVILVCDVDKIAPLQKDEIAKSFRIEKK
jgi:hypothetical protein